MARFCHVVTLSFNLNTPSNSSFRLKRAPLTPKPLSPSISAGFSFLRRSAEYFDPDGASSSAGSASTSANTHSTLLITGDQIEQDAPFAQVRLN